MSGERLLPLSIACWRHRRNRNERKGRYGQTAGKRWLGLHVVKENGAPIGFKEAFLRRLSFYFDFLVVDAIFIFFTAKRQRAFDMIARTVVIQDAP